MDYLVDITIKAGNAARDDDLGDRLLTALEALPVVAGGVYQGEAGQGLVTVHLLVSAPDVAAAAEAARHAVAAAWAEVVPGITRPVTLRGMTVDEAPERQEAASRS